MLSWIVVVIVLFLVYMAFDGWMAEYHSFKMMEHERYLAWLEAQKKETGE